MRERKFRERDAALKFSNWIKSFQQKLVRQGSVIYRKNRSRLGGFRFKGWWSQDLQQMIVTFNKSDKVGAVHDWAITSIIITWLRCSCLYLLPQTLDNLAPIKILKLSNCCNVKFWGNRSGDGGGWQGVEFNYTSWTPCSKFGHHLVIYGIIWYYMVFYSIYKLNTHAENMAILIFHHLVFSKNASAVDVIRLHADRKWNLIIHAGFPPCRRE